MKKRLTKEQVLLRLAAISSQLAKKYKLSFVILFGSYAKGEESPISDVDIGVFLKSEQQQSIQRTVTEKKESLERMLAIKAEIEQLLGTEVDLVIVNTAPPVLKYEILTNIYGV